MIQLFADNGDQILIVFRHNRRHFEHGYIRTEMPVRLRHFDTDGPAADHNQMTWQLILLEYVFIGEIRHVLNAGDRRHKSPRSCCNHEPPGLNALTARFNFLRAGKPCGSFNHVYAKTLETLHRIIRFDSGDRVMDMAIDFGIMNIRRIGMDAESM